MLSLTVTGLDDLRRLQAAIDPKRLQKATASAVRYASRSVPPQAGRSIASRYTIASRRARADVAGPFLRGSGDGLQAELRFSRRPPTAAQFGARMKGPNLSYRLYRGAAPVVVRNGFLGIARGRQLPLRPKAGSVYLKDVQAGRRRPRVGLDVVHAPSLGSLALSPRARFGDEIRAELRETIARQFARGFERAMGAAARGYGP